VREFRGIFHGRKSKLVSQELYGKEEKCMKGFFLVGKLEEREHLEGLSVDGRTILKSILSKWDEGA
jgi:hypothetical protein